MNLRKAWLFVAALALAGMPLAVQADYQIGPNPNPQGNTITIASWTDSNDARNWQDFENNGTLSINGIAYLTNEDGAALTNNSGAYLTNYGALTNHSGAVLFNYGTLSNITTTSGWGLLDNSGTLYNYSGAGLYNSGTLSNSGTLYNVGTLYNSVELDNYATLSNYNELDQNGVAFGPGLATNNLGTLKMTGSTDWTLVIIIIVIGIIIIAALAAVMVMRRR